MESPPAFSGRIKSPELRTFYRRWRTFLIDGPGLPRIESFDPGELAPMSFAIAVERGGFRFIRFGDRLADWLGESLLGRHVDNEAAERFGSLRAAYRSCAEHQTPSYESMKYDFGGGETVSFERVVVPFFGRDNAVSHLAGAVMIEDADVVGNDAKF